MILSETIVYYLDDVAYEGVVCWDDAFSTKRPGVLVSHQWMGQGAFEIEKAKSLAIEGYVALAFDMYGQGKRAEDTDEAGALMNACLEDRSEMLEKIRNALSVLKNHELVDENRVAGIGFCFGGKCMLDLARSGEDIKGVVSFHGIYDQPDIEYIGPIKASVLVLHGWDDPLATPEQMVALGRELTERKADWQILAFGHTGHAFTNPKAAAPDSGMFYQKSSNDRARRAMISFFEEVFE